MTTRILRTAIGLVCSLSTVVALPGLAPPAWAEEFRVENKVFLSDKKDGPAIESTTIFLDDQVYDYLTTPEEITVLDRHEGRFVLLDPVRRIRTELATSELSDLAERLRQWAAGQPNEFLRFSAAPELAETYDASTGELRLDSPWIAYRVATTTAKRSEIAKRYREFCDWYCLLNTRINPGARPPFARTQVNKALERLDLLPKEVHLTIRPEGGKLFGQKITVRSEHQVIPHLVESDRARVAQTDQFMAMFPTVSFRQYQSRIEPGK